jgi:ketosteroid isomerase-like protein
VSGANVELHRRLFAAFNARDLEAFMAFCDPEIEFHSTFANVGGGVYHGREGLRSWHRDFEETWGEIRLDPEAYFDFGERTLAFYVASGRGRQSRVEVAQSAAHVAEWRAGLCVSAKAYVHREDALTVLGVSEAALEPWPVE